jgi:tetratricopeptide (TPR) repeat protein
VESGVNELRTLVSRALELDPTLGEAYAALGILKLFFDWDWDGARTALLHAIELNPSDPHAYHHLANYLHAMGRFAEAAATREQAVELDPLNARTHFTLASDYLQGGDPERAMAHFRRAFELDPVNPLALGFGPVLPGGPAEVYSWQARYPEAVEEFIKIAALRGASAREMDVIRNSFASSGMSGFWQSWLEMDLRQSGANPNSVRVAKLLALIGDTTASFAWLDRAYDERNPGLIYLRFDPEFEGLHEHPRIARILRSMKFPS